MNVLALSGGIGGAKLALGLSKILPPADLTIVANTADDFVHMGLAISPDLDTVMYTLAGINNQQLGWGLNDESWNAMTALKQLGAEAWFQLGDRDLATHIIRTEALARGISLSEVTDQLCEKLNVEHSIIPMSDDKVATRVETDQGILAFQHYFVREQCKPRIKRISFEGIDQAQPSARFLELLTAADLGAIVICPSNPFVSVDPILQLPGIRAAINASHAPVIAVSPIVAGSAIKGPAAKMMEELGLSISALAVAEHYGKLVDGFVIDEADQHLADLIQELGMNVCVAPTIMNSLESRIALADHVLAFAETCRMDMRVIAASGEL